RWGRGALPSSPFGLRRGKERVARQSLGVGGAALLSTHAARAPRPHQHPPKPSSSQKSSFENFVQRFVGFSYQITPRFVTSSVGIPPRPPSPSRSPSATGSCFTPSTPLSSCAVQRPANAEPSWPSHNSPGLPCALTKLVTKSVRPSPSIGRRGKISWL